MNWFTDIPRLVLLCFAILTGIGAVILIISLSFEDPNESGENLDKATEYLSDNIVPTEINWISWLADKLSDHPFLLFGSIAAVLWFFGYFLPKDA